MMGEELKTREFLGIYLDGSGSLSMEDLHETMTNGFTFLLWWKIGEREFVRKLCSEEAMAMVWLWRW